MENERRGRSRLHTLLIFLAGFLCGNIRSTVWVAFDISKGIDKTSGDISQIASVFGYGNDQNDDDDDDEEEETRDESPVRMEPVHTVGKWPNPTIVVGLPKAGTNSIAEYFRCGGVKKVVHHRCLGKACGAVIQRNILAGRNPFFNTGRANVYVQIDVELNVDKGLPCYFPQVEALEEMHRAHPNSTLLLNIRDVEGWIQSLRSWSGMDHRIAKCNITGLPRGKGLRDHELRTFFESHTTRIRQFVSRHPSHKLVEVAIDTPEAGMVLERAFGIDRSCWGHHNSNKQDVTEQGESRRPLRNAKSGRRGVLT